MVIQRHPVINGLVSLLLRTTSFNPFYRLVFAMFLTLWRIQCYLADSFTFPSRCLPNYPKYRLHRTSWVTGGAIAEASGTVDWESE